MIVSYDAEFSNPIVCENLDRVCNQIFKLLPMREEGKDWVKPLETLIVELMGMNSLLSDQKDLFPLVCKLEGLRSGGNDIEFPLYRRTIFECCGLVDQVKKDIRGEV